METGESAIDMPSADMIREMWVTQRHFPYGTNELEEAHLTAVRSDNVTPRRIKECKAHIECKALWTKTIGSTSLVLGSIEAVSMSKEMEKLDVKERAIALNRLIFFSYQREESVRKWMFAQMGRIHILTEKDGEIEMKSEII